MAEPSQFGPYAEQEVRSQPSLGQTLTGLVSGLVPGYSPNEPWYQKVPDLLSLPARAAVQLNPLVQGGQAMDRWMAGDQGPETQQALTGSALGLMTGGFGRPTPGPASFGAWHGSRHLFAPEPEAPLGAFKPIEEVAHTGEGSQAFAYGHYVAGKPSTAETYRTAGSDLPEHGVFKMDGQVVKPLSFWDAGDYTVPGTAERMQKYWGMNFLSDHDGNHAAAIKDLQDQARGLYKQATSYGPAVDPHGVEMDKQGLLQNAKEYIGAAKWLGDNQGRLSYEPPDKGHLYQVSVRPDEHELLDWDKPLRQQSSQVRDAVQNMIPPSERFFYPTNLIHMTGHEIYDEISATRDGPSGASRRLHEAGVPGIKFLDRGSRDIEVYPGDELNASGEPDQWHVANDQGTLSSHNTESEAEAEAEARRTRNYVIFHHSNLKVIGRDGQHYGLTPVGHDPWATSQ